MNLEIIKKKIEKLDYAKKAVLAIIENANTLVDMHGLAYWAGVVENLREEIKKSL